MNSPAASARTHAGVLGTPPWHASREFQLLICLARRDLEPAGQARLEELLAAPIGWDRFYRLALRHHLLPLCTRHLTRVDRHRVPAAVLRAMRDFSMQNARHNLMLTGELCRLLRLMAGAGIPMLGYKGPVLAQRVYGSIALRDMLDLDLLVRPDDLQPALSLLIRSGYSPAAPRDPRWDSHLFRSGSNYPVVHDISGTVVELHWKPETSLSARRVGELWRRLEHVSLAGIEIPTFGRDDLLVLLCLHGCRHMWERLEWVAGVAELVRTDDGAAADVLSAASALGGRRALFVGLILAHELLGAPVAPELRRRALADRQAISLAIGACAQLFSDSPMVAHQLGFPFHSFQLRSRERLRDRARYLGQRTMTASRADWEASRQPWLLFRLQCLARRLRAIAAYSAWACSGSGTASRPMPNRGGD